MTVRAASAPLHYELPSLSSRLKPASFHLLPTTPSVTPSPRKHMELTDFLHSLSLSSAHASISSFGLLF
jgi:hypothetical protein